MAPGPLAQRHRPISHGHTQTERAAVSQPAQLTQGTPHCLGPLRVQQTAEPFSQYALFLTRAP